MVVLELVEVEGENGLEEINFEEHKTAGVSLFFLVEPLLALSVNPLGWDHFVGFNLFIITGKCDIKEIFVLSQFLKGST